MTTYGQVYGLTRAAVMGSATELFDAYRLWEESRVLRVVDPVPLLALPVTAKHPPVCYFIRCGREVKIGTTTKLRQRLYAVVTGKRYELKLVVEGSYSTESQLHQMFRRLRVRGEWFRYGDELRKFVESNS